MKPFFCCTSRPWVVQPCSISLGASRDGRGCKGPFPVKPGGAPAVSCLPFALSPTVWSGGAPTAGAGPFFAGSEAGPFVEESLEIAQKNNQRPGYPGATAITRSRRRCLRSRPEPRLT